ncbi:MAG: S41 family peptidase [Luteibaculaceae bacterium]
MKKKIAIGFFALVLVAGISASYSSKYFEISKNLEIFTNVFKELNTYYVVETEPGRLMRGGLDAMLETLDPYTNFIAESDIEDYRYMTTGQYGGVGALIRKVGDFVIVTDPYEDMPAQLAGVRAGDKILTIDGKDMRGLSTSDVSDRLKGQSGSTVKITVERPGTSETLSFTIERKEIKIPDVPFYDIVAPGIGYIKLTSFTNTASSEVKKAYNDLKNNKGMEKLIFDLRGNGGGLLTEAIEISNFFIPKGNKIVSTKGKISAWEKTHYAQKEPLDTLMPLIVLVDGSSASASEIVSGAIQDYDRGIVLGQRTFGKGLVQQTRDVGYNSKLKLTVAKYYIPSGRCIQEVDYSRNADADGNEIEKAVTKFTTRNGRVVEEGHGVDPDVAIDEREFARVVAFLMVENHIFDFATDFALKNEKIANPELYTISDAQYEEFIQFVKGRNFEFDTKTEERLKALREAAKDELYYENGITEMVQKLEAELKDLKKDDLIKHQTDIRELLANEIVSRYYFQTGRIKASLASDNFIQRSIELLGNKEDYKEVLSGPLSAKR